MAEELLLIDDRAGATPRTGWTLVSDAVMGGVSQGTLRPDVVQGRTCLCLRGRISLDNNGGFLQMALDLAPAGELDASAWAGVLLDVHGNGEQYNLHLRTGDLTHPWQSYRASFSAGTEWRTLRIPFTGMLAHRTDAALDLRRLRRLGVVAIGRAFDAWICIGRLALYRQCG